MTYLIKDEMHKKVFIIGPEDLLEKAAKKMNSKGISCLVVMKGKEPVGIIAERDFVSKLIIPGKNIKTTMVRDVMTKKLITLQPENTIEEAVDLLAKKKINKLPIVKNGKLEGIITMTDLLLALRRIEKSVFMQLKKSNIRLIKSHQRLKDMDLKKDEFISIAAHELETPLTLIHGFSQRLMEKKVINNHAKRVKFLSILDRESRRLADLVSDILDLSRIDMGTMRFSLEKVDVAEVVNDVRKEMDSKIKEKGLKSEYEVEGNLPSIRTDKSKLFEILFNLIVNAVKYTPTGKINVKVFRDKENVHFMIKDTGIGIPEKYHERIFERFYQVDSAYTRRVGGTGLGLSLCQEYVITLGGKIWVVSKPKKGSEFHFMLPRKGKIKKI